MNSLQFVIKYEAYINEIQQVTKTEFQPAIDALLQIDPHDLVRPDTFFLNESAARGYVWTLFLKKLPKVIKTQD